MPQPTPHAAAFASLSSGRFYTAQDVAALLKVTPRTVYLWIQRGHLKGTRLAAGCIRVAQRDLDAFLAAANGNPADLPRDGQGESDSPPAVKLPAKVTAPPAGFRIDQKHFAGLPRGKTRNPAKS